MFKTLQHLLPDGRAFSSTLTKSLRSFLQGVSEQGDDVKTSLDDTYDEIWPPTTGSLTEWDAQFGLRMTSMTDAERRSRLDAAWKAQGGQDPDYIQATLRAAGFDVYVHDWWIPGTEPAIGSHAAATPRNPFTYLRATSSSTGIFVSCGDTLAMCGEPTALCGNSSSPLGYPLVNIVPYSAPAEIVFCGEEVAMCGELDALAGNSITYGVKRREYELPLDTTKWPYFLYIGGEVFGQNADVSAARKDEFEALCLKICPLQLWIGVMVTYS